MKKPNRSKPWRVNLVVDYFDYPGSVSCHDEVLQILAHIASIHKLDYRLSVDHKFSLSSDSYQPENYRRISDLAYFRSNDDSKITGKEFRSVISCMFGKAILPHEMEVSVCHQHYKVLSQYPFPSN